MSTPDTATILASIAELGARCACAARTHTTYGIVRQHLADVAAHASLCTGIAQGAGIAAGRVPTSRATSVWSYRTASGDTIDEVVTQLAREIRQGEHWTGAGHNLGMLAQAVLSGDASRLAQAIEVNSVYFREDTSVQDQVAWRDAVERLATIVDSVGCLA